ncbi:MAG: hypothetical protein NTY38_07005, partial [Acidobacteria bacterium]|nr:hypothetical protein [Acidobacteriota bacterium]
NHADLVTAFAPKPYLICSTEQDFFPLEGAVRTFTEAKRLWALAGAPDRIQWFHEPGEHGTPKATREAIYGWMKHWLSGGPAGPAPEAAIHVEYEQDLNATPTGQLSTSLGGETASSSNGKRYAAWPRPPEQSPAALRETVLSLTRAEIPAGAVQVRRLETSAREGYQLQRILFDSAPGRFVPAFLATPAHPRGQAVLYAGDDAAAAAFTVGGDLDKLAALGYTVLAIDVAGRGETTPAWEGYASPWFGKLHKTAWLGLMVGRPMVGLHVEDIIRALDVLASKEPVIGFGKGPGAVDLLHAAVVDPRLGALALEKMLLSYRAFATSPLHRQLAEVVRAAYGSANVRIGLRREADTVLDAWPELR